MRGGVEAVGMSVNTFDDEDEMSAAYDAAERALWHAIDSGELLLQVNRGDVAHKTVRELSRRIADAVIHSSAEDITDMGLGVKVERG
jgi:hypothetical protein